MDVLTSVFISAFLFTFILAVLSIIWPRLAGQTQRGKAFGIYIGISLAAFLAGGFAAQPTGQGDEATKSTDAAGPEMQGEFEKRISGFSQRYSDAENALKADQVVTQARQSLREFARSYDHRVTGWQARVDRIWSEDDGGAALLQLVSEDNGPTIQYQTESGHGAERGSSVYQAISSLGEGAVVQFSARFRESKKTGIAEASITDLGFITAPEYLVEFTKISVATSAAEAEKQREAEQAAADAKCRKQLRCWAEKHLADAEYFCKPAIEGLAAYSHKWTDGFLESPFSRYQWADEAGGPVAYYGDNVQFQNGFGAWKPHTYRCVYDPDSESVGDVAAEPGTI